VIQLNVILPSDTELDEDRELDVINHSRHQDFNYYLVETTEEYFTILTLKYGKDSVWRR